MSDLGDLLELLHGAESPFESLSARFRIWQHMARAGAAFVADVEKGPGAALTWASENSEKWTRNIPGIGGELAAIQMSSGAPVLQLHDLSGNIVRTAALSESETKLLSTYNSTEFGVPTTSSPPKYSWLGADGVASELTSSGVSTQNGSSYVPEIGRPLQTGPIASPGSFPNGTGGVGIVSAPYLGAASTQLAAAAAQQWAEKEEAKRRETEERAFMEEGMCEKYPDSSACHVDGPGEGNCEVNCLTVIGGEGEAEGEIGDPIDCNVKAFAPEEGQARGVDILKSVGTYECKGNLHKGEFEFCLEDLTNAEGICNKVTNLSDSKGIAGVQAQCIVGHDYVTFAWVWEPPKGTPGVGTFSEIQTTCYNEALEGGGFSGPVDEI
jgi:hypothetical protein